jgi:hypothetical protein
LFERSELFEALAELTEPKARKKNSEAESEVVSEAK